MRTARWPAMRRRRRSRDLTPAGSALYDCRSRDHGAPRRSGRRTPGGRRHHGGTPPDRRARPKDARPRVRGGGRAPRSAHGIARRLRRVVADDRRPPDPGVGVAGSTASCQGAWFAVAVWAVWRIGHFALDRMLGTAGDSVFFYDGERYLPITQQGYSYARLPDAEHGLLPRRVVAGVADLARSPSPRSGPATSSRRSPAIAAFVAVWGVTKAWRNERIARRAVLLMALLPSSLFLWAFYSEGLFIALGAGAVWADRREPALDRRAAVRRPEHHPVGRHPGARGDRPGPDHPPAAASTGGAVDLRRRRRSPASCPCC